MKQLVEIHGENSWHKICKLMPNKTEIRCFKRWNLFKQKEISFATEKEIIKDNIANLNS